MYELSPASATPADVAREAADALGIPASILEPLVRPSLRTVLRAAGPADLARGGSRFGGLPDLPPDYPWPMCGSTPLVHGIQLNLASLPRFHDLILPATGLLSIFYDAENLASGYSQADRSGWHVAWFEDVSTLVPRAIPAEIDESWRWDALGLDFYPTWTLPQTDSPELAMFKPPYERMVDFGLLNDRLEVDWGKHRIGGWWDSSQDDIRWCAEIGTRSTTEQEWKLGIVTPVDAAACARWRLLFQWDSVRLPDGPEVMIGDLDKVCFLIRQEDLDAQDFGAAWAVWVG